MFGNGVNGSPAMAFETSDNGSLDLIEFILHDEDAPLRLVGIPAGADQ